MYVRWVFQHSILLNVAVTQHHHLHKIQHPFITLAPVSLNLPCLYISSTWNTHYPSVIFKYHVQITTVFQFFSFYSFISYQLCTFHASNRERWPSFCPVSAHSLISVLAFCNHVISHTTHKCHTIHYTFGSVTNRGTS